jgi:formate hydrogenlyase subunit 4
LIIGLAGYVSFARTREGAAPARSVAEGVLGAVMLSLLLGIGTFWLFGATMAHVVEANLGVLSLSFVAALVGAFTAVLRPRRAPLPRW